jgi:hypothetical protein
MVENIYLKRRITMFETKPNQKVITVNKEICDKEHLFSPYNLDALQKAMTDLDGFAFKMWCYLGKNQKGYEFALSKKDAISNWGMGSKSSYDRAVAELIQKGYLVETSPNHYDFYEIPRADDDDVVYITHQ